MRGSQADANLCKQKRSATSYDLGPLSIVSFRLLLIGKPEAVEGRMIAWSNTEGLFILGWLLPKPSGPLPLDHSREARLSPLVYVLPLVVLVLAVVLAVVVLLCVFYLVLLIVEQQRILLATTVAVVLLFFIIHLAAGIVASIRTFFC